ncbi:MAG: response regulator [Chitinophagaceae bacterium]
MPSQSPHILVVDDNEEILTAISIILHRKDYRVSVRSRVDHFEQTIMELLPDLILLDKNLGWADGGDLCKNLKANSSLSHIPVIMFSAYYKMREECMNAGANEFIEKPFEMNDLLQTIHSFAHIGKQPNV